MKVDWEKPFNRVIEVAGEVAGGAAGAAFYHILTEKRDKEGAIIVGKDNKPEMMLDVKKLRTEAPHFAKGLEDEAEFNVLVSRLNPGLQKNLEEKMGPAIGMGPHLPVIGNNQRADIILTHCEITVRPGWLGNTEAEKLENGRKTAVEVLRQLAEIDDRQEWIRRAVAFRLMKENEQDYIGAQLSERARATLAALLADLDNVRVWMDFDAAQAEVSANGIFEEVRQMAGSNVFVKIWRGLTSPLRF